MVAIACPGWLQVLNYDQPYRAYLRGFCRDFINN